MDQAPIPTPHDSISKSSFSIKKTPSRKLLNENSLDESDSLSQSSNQDNDSDHVGILEVDTPDFSVTEDTRERARSLVAPESEKTIKPKKRYSLKVTIPITLLGLF
jgi:hypothetical protein